LLKKVNIADGTPPSSSVNFLEGFDEEVFQSLSRNILNDNPDWHRFCRRWITHSLENFKAYQSGKCASYYVHLSKNKSQSLEWRLVRGNFGSSSQDRQWFVGSEFEVFAMLSVNPKSYARNEEYRILRPQELNEVPRDFFRGVVFEMFVPDKIPTFKRNFISEARKTLLGLQTSLAQMDYRLKRGEFPRRGDVLVLSEKTEERLFLILDRLAILTPISLRDDGSFNKTWRTIDIDVPLGEIVFENDMRLGYYYDRAESRLDGLANPLFVKGEFGSLEKICGRQPLSPKNMRRFSPQEAFQEFQDAINI
jgi:hypothetical protein